MNVTVTAEAAEAARNEGSVYVVTGVDPETGDWVTFAGDHRPMAQMFQAAMDEGEVTAVVEDYQVTRLQPLKRIRVTMRAHRSAGANAREVDAYLPGNYSIVGADAQFVYLAGHDQHGWTSQYVIDRLASGLIWGADEEYTEPVDRPHQGWREQPEIPRFGADEVDHG